MLFDKKVDALEMSLALTNDYEVGVTCHREGDRLVIRNIRLTGPDKAHFGETASVLIKDDYVSLKEVMAALSQIHASEPRTPF